MTHVLASRSGNAYSGLVGTDFELVGEIEEIETIARNLSVRERRNLKDRFGGQRWRKLKGRALVRFPNGAIRPAELHWYG